MPAMLIQLKIHYKYQTDVPETLISLIFIKTEDKFVPTFFRQMSMLKKNQLLKLWTALLDFPILVRLLIKLFICHQIELEPISTQLLSGLQGFDFSD